MKKSTTENQPWATLTHLGGSRDHGAYLLGEPDGEKIKRRRVSPCAFAAIDGLAFNRVIAVVEREGNLSANAVSESGLPSAPEMAPW